MEHRVDWEALWSIEARKKQLPSLHGIVSRYTKEPDVIPMHGGLPPASTFPFTSFQCGLLPLPPTVSDTDAAACKGESRQQQPQDSCVLRIEEPALVCAAQQYNMHAQGYAPLVAWARDLVTDLHKPATLKQQQPQHAQQPQQQQQPYGTQQQHEEVATAEPPVGLEVVITPGASAALDSLVRVLVNPGDPVLVEEYTYAHMVEAHLLPLGCELLPVQLDGSGVVPEHLDALLTARQASGLAMPKLLYTIPTGQNPTGAVMDAARMAQVYALARKWRLVIVEDDAYFWLQYPQGPDAVPGLNLRPGFLSLDTDGRVVRVDTLAKLLGPGFRLGWLSGPPALVAKLGVYLAGISIGANMVSQVMLHELLAKTWGRSGFESFIRRLQSQYARQAAVAAAAAEQQLAGLAEWAPARAGMFMWLRLTGDLESESLIEAAAACKVMVVPGHLISVAHLQAAHRRKLAAAAPVATQQQCSQSTQGQQQQEMLLQQLEELTQQLQQQVPQGSAATGEGAAGSNSSSSSGECGIASIAAQLASISLQLQHLHGLGSSSRTSPAVQSASDGSDSPFSSTTTAAEAAAGAGQPAAAAAAGAGQTAAVGGADHTPPPCPFFRVSFVSVPAETIQEGFVRLRAAILALHGPQTPPGEESEISSCSSSIGSSAAAVHSGSNALCCYGAAAIVGTAGGEAAGGAAAASGAAAGVAAAAATAASGGGDSALC